MLVKNEATLTVDLSMLRANAAFGSGGNYRMYELASGIYERDAFSNLAHQWLHFRLCTKWMCSKN